MDRSQAPGKISPLVKGARWGFLLVGIVYGSARCSSLNKKEKIKKAELERTRPEREAKAAAERERKIKAEEEDLIKQIGLDLSKK